ncbi:1-acyl-sn-glycerol-3-phosphate acyltransferase [Hymenobacter sp. BT683]|uniref:1-acyl-sn-glycerol-3-phosphate acyltransferase n=1 Tax=Hymenobacter jeongseonensis TaxID=2791027 RepID=A0ABS0IDU3_9BACT|nr:lysophospholipid acyltransferase family protein [Hymenobacter jeongseonensis]MBF9236138.1 1-acyl-sn-glycerol-3-phosphate acyltransferase [Hymenobacter jeongseonensis]
MLFYTVIKPILQVALRVFFRNIEVRHRERLALPGPLLFAGNHPNTLMDPLLVGINSRQPVAFLAKSTFFQNPILRSIMASGNSIPIYRRQDVGTGPITPAEFAAQNEATFGRCYDYLGEGGTIMIFPEGTSVSERRLRPLKTGAARIALGAEARHQFKLGLKVVPIAINYFDPSRFRSDVLLNVAPPIVVADYAELYATDPEAAAVQLTDTIREALERRLVITRDAADDVFVQQIERTFGDHLNLDDDDPHTLYDNFQLSQTLLQALAWFDHNAPTRLVAVRQQLHIYLQALRKHRLTDEALEGQRRGTIVGLLNLVLGLPVWLYGVLNNYLPYILPSIVAKRATKEIEFVAPIMLVVGMITFPLAYGLQAAAVHHWLTHDWRLTALYVLSLPFTGFYALSYWQTLTARLARLRALRLFQRAPAVGAALLEQRAALAAQLEEARDAYLARAVPR